MSSIIIGTSGHIDHGKTTLLKALTGVSLDKSPEEKKRGITIDLGFTHLELPSGKSISFVDVPGHERLVRTMIAGASGMDAVLLCISAVEGVMPQTREHIDILNLLGVTDGIIAITMTDLVDEELLELAEMDIEDAVAGTPFEDFPIVHTAAGENPVGIDALMTQLEHIKAKETTHSAPFRLFIDRVFVQQGFGTVVTGTARGQSITQGETLLIHPTGLRTRVRNIQQHGNVMSHTVSGQRTALNLAGLSHTDLARGHVILRDDSVPPTSIIDISYSHLNDAPKLKSGSQVRFLVGSSEVLARIYFYGGADAEEGSDCFAQVRLSNPVRVLPQDRVIIRRESPVTTLGGGEVIDPFAPKLRQKNQDFLLQTLQSLFNGDTLSALERRGSKGMAVGIAQLWDIEETPYDGCLYHPKIVERWCAEMRRLVGQHHQAHPLSMGIPLRELHSQSLHFLSPKAFESLIQTEVEQSHYCIDGAKVRLSDFKVELSPAQAQLASAIIDATLSAGWEGITMPTDNLDLVHYLLSTDAIVSIQKQLVHPKQVKRLIDSLHQFFNDNPILTPVDFKGITGLSRKHAIPWLEWLDSNGITQRTSEGRKLKQSQ